MSKGNIYEEAISDVRQLKKVAEEKAMKSLVESVEPKIKAFIEKQLFESSEDETDECYEEEQNEASVAANVAGFTGPLGASPDDDELYETDGESSDELDKVSEAIGLFNDDKFEISVYKLEEEALRLVTSDVKHRDDNTFLSSIKENISILEHMYSYLRESYSAKNSPALEQKLERSYKLLNSIKESTEMKMKNLLKEDDMVLKVTGLPDGVDADALSIDLISDEPSEEAGTEEVSAEDGTEEVSSEEAPADETAPSDDEEVAVESADGDEDDEIIEISESELKAELAKIRGGLNEEDGVSDDMNDDANILDDFADGEDEGTPEVDDLGIDLLETEKEDEPKKESWKAKMEAYKAKKESKEAKKDSESDEKSEAKKDDVEGAKEELKEARARFLRCKGKITEGAAKKVYQAAISKYDNAKKLAESNKKKTTQNSESVKQLKESRDAVRFLRNKLAEANLLNAKLIHVNKFLRVEGLTVSQKKMVIDRLDEATNLREVRLVSESLKKALNVGTRDSLNESAKRAPVGSSSKAVKSGSPVIETKETLNESNEGADRWQLLAGLK